MDCRKVREVVFLYTDNEMGEELLISFRRHTDICPRCAQLVQKAQKVVMLVRKRCVRTSAPAGLRRRILTSFPHRRDRV
jgi:mycothiol system anti-sigma-R factor